MASAQRTGLAFLLAAILTGLGAPAWTKAPAPSHGRPDFSDLTDRVDDWVNAGLYPGAGLLIGKGDHILLERYFGSYGPASRVHVASAGKWLAAATIAALVDRGALRWDDPAALYVPGLPLAMRRATLRQLLSHVAGYPDYQPTGRPRDHYQTLAESIAHIQSLQADDEPGARFHYGGLAMQVAGRMAEIATGQDWDSIFQTIIARPLGMADTGFTPVPDEEGFSPMLGGSAHTTLRDYGRFLQMIAAGGRFAGRTVLSSAAVAEMERDQVGRALIGPAEFVALARARPHHGIYGLGEWREELDTRGRAVLLGSAGWAGAYPWVDRRTGIYGFMLAKVDVPRAKALGFSSFLASPVLASLARRAMLSASHPLRHGFVAVPGGRLYWEERGKGPPLILLHGHSFDRTMWDPQMAVLSRQFRVIRYDLRGYGRSSMPEEGGHHLHADDLVAVMDALGIPKAHLVGLSLGGSVAIDMVALHPDRLLSVTAASGDIFDFYPAPDEPWTPDAIGQRRSEIAALRAGGVDAFKRQWLDQLTSRGGRCVNAIRPQLWEMIAAWSAWQPLHVEPRLLLGRAAPAMLLRNRSQVPVQILTGDADAERPSRYLQLFPRTRHVEIPNAGHVINLENPAGFNAAVSAFARHPQDAAASLFSHIVSPCP